MRPISLALCLCVLFSFAHPAMAADKWISVHSKNFLLVGNAGESDLRRVGRTLEEFRSAVALTFPNMEQTSSVPTTIVVFKNDESFKPFKPLYKGQPSEVLAYFQPGEDVNYIALTATLPSPNIVLHEYVHFLLRENIGGLPLWISEGLAECYSTFDLNSKQTEFTLGRAPETHIATLSQPQQFIPLKRMLAIQPGSPEYNETSKQGMFYAESWAMVHYLMLGADAKRKNQFTQLLASIAQGKPFDTSFSSAFQTDYGTLEEEVREYIRKRSSWPMMKVTSKEPIQADARSMAAATLSDGESEEYLGDLLLHLNRLPDAEIHLTAATSKSPALNTAQASLALLRIRQKKYDEALTLLKKAVDADSRNPIVNFYYAYVLERVNADATATFAGGAADRYEAMRTYTKKSIELAPRFVESYALLARADMNAGEHLDEAESTLKKAISIAPGRDDLQMLLAQTYLRGNRTAEARTVLESLQRTGSSIETANSAAALLDQTEQSVQFTEITQGTEKEAPRPAAALAPPPTRKPEDTVLEALTPIRPNVEGEKVTGSLINLDCADGLTMRVRTDKGTIELHSANPDNIQFLSYTSDVNNSIKCGPQNPAAQVTVTYRPVPGGLGNPLVLEFLEKKN